MGKDFRLSFADAKLIQEIAEPEILIPHVPRFETLFEGIAEKREMEAQSSTCGKYTRMSGFTPDGEMQFLGTVPQSVAAAVRVVDDGFWEDPKKVLWFFQHFPQYKVTSKVH